MAKVKIQGNASGTGVITLIAPNTNTDRTVTLPDESITLGGGVDGIVSTANATAITIDSSENVGIGVVPNSGAHTSWKNLSIGTKGNIFSSSAAGGIYGLHTTDNSYIKSSTGNYAYLTTNEASVHTQEAGKHIFKVAPSGTADAAISWTTALTINNDGIVTMPLQPAFGALNNSNQTLSNGTKPQFPTERFDNNGDYNNSTYVFTAPVTGKYQLNMTARLDDLTNTMSYGRMYLDTSNESYASIISGDPWDSTMSYYTFNICVVADMDAGDTATGRWTQSGGGAPHLDGGANASFSGHLVG
jgi:hypothetical protein